MRQTGLAPLRVHDLRHTCAALLIEQGTHVKEIADCLGHSTPTVTMQTYAHILPALEERTAAGLERAFEESARAVTHVSPGAGNAAVVRIDGLPENKP